MPCMLCSAAPCLVFEDDILLGDGPLLLWVPDDQVSVQSGAQSPLPGVQSGQPRRAGRHQTTDLVQRQSATARLSPEHRQVCGAGARSGGVVQQREM